MGTPEAKIDWLQSNPGWILSLTGDMFVTGIVGASAYHFIKGMYNSPSGVRLSGGAQAVRMNALSFGKRCAVWGGLYTTFKCALESARKEEDAWNFILSASAASGLVVMMRGGGLASSARWAAVGGGLIALLERADTMLEKWETLLNNE